MSSSIAIFILATTISFNNYNYWDRRIQPISNTWGKQFTKLYYVMGTNMHDKIFLERNCIISHGRRLRPHFPQTKTSDELLTYLCPIESPENYTINVLFMANCTGEYFGLGNTINAI
jgi:hypothetical protein